MVVVMIAVLIGALMIVMIDTMWRRTASMSSPRLRWPLLANHDAHRSRTRCAPEGFR